MQDDSASDAKYRPIINYYKIIPLFNCECNNKTNDYARKNAGIYMTKIHFEQKRESRVPMDSAFIIGLFN